MTVSAYRLMKAGNVAASNRGSAFPTGARYVVIPARGLPTAVRWSFLLFVFAVPFEETMDLGFLTGSVSLPKIFGYLFFASYFLYYNPLLSERSLPRVPHVVWWFLGYLAVFTLGGLFVSAEVVGEFLERFFTLAQLVVFFWIASDLLKDQKMAKRVLLTYSAGVVFLAMATLLRLPGFFTELEGARVTAGAENATNLATLMALAVATLIGLSLRTAFVSKIFIAVLMLPLITVLVNTGARGGVVALMVGCSVYLLPYWRSRRTLTVIILAILATVAVGYMIVTNPDFLERWQEAFEGNLTGREEIYSAGIEMALERPIFGWHPVEASYELGSRTGHSLVVYTHNLFLDLFLDVGVVGAIPFFVGLWLCGRAAWRARKGDLALLPLALLVTILITSMSNPALLWKPFWLALALSLAPASTAVMEQVRQARIFLRRSRLRRGVLRSS